MGRIGLFLALDPADFYQLLFLPIENEEMMKKIKKALATFEIFNESKKMMSHGYKGNSDLSGCKKLKISRGDLIEAGIPQNWFVDQIDEKGLNTIQKENVGIDLA